MLRESSTETSPVRRVFLWGMPGAGKTTGGKRIAYLLGWDWIDLDAALEEHAGMPITEIFRLRGETGFRELEAKVLHQVLQRGTSFIMSTGGGTPCFHDLDAVMNRAGLTIFMDCPSEELVRRLVGESVRPLLGPVDEDRESRIRHLLLQRRSFYERAQRKVDVSTSVGWEVALAGCILQWSTRGPEHGV